MSIELGQQVKDSITGYKGTAVGRTSWLYGCERIAIQGPLDKDGKVPELVWFDETQLVMLHLKRVAKKRDKDATPAGTRDNVSRFPLPNPVRNKEEAR